MVPEVCEVTTWLAVSHSEMLAKNGGKKLHMDSALQDVFRFMVPRGFQSNL